MDRAERLGSKASTLKGAAQFIVRNTNIPLPLVLPGDTGWQVKRFGAPRPEGRWSIRTMTQDERDIRRAMADPRFRRQLVARLRREFRTLTSPPDRTAREVTRAHDSRRTNQDRIKAIQAALAQISPKLKPSVEQMVGLVRVPVVEMSARRAGASLDMRGLDAEIKPCVGTSRLEYHPPETVWKKGRPVGYTRAVRINHVRSFAVLNQDDPRTLEYALGVHDQTITLPEGFRWSIDHLGLRACWGEDDYHVDSGDLYRPDAGEWVARQLIKAAERRDQEAQSARAELGDLSGVYVCLADSLRAGNCRAGSVAFVGRMALDPSRHYPAQRLAPLIATEPRVKLAIRQAVVRTKQEIERGYAVLSDHRVATE